MGTKGRDIVIWLYGLLMLMAAMALISGKILFGRVLFILALLNGFALLYFYAVYLPKAKKYSREELKLKTVVLLPIWNWWGKILTGSRINGRVKKTFEIHLNDIEGGEGGLAAYIKNYRRDLISIAGRDNMSGNLVIWESHLPPPSVFRKAIREREKIQKAYLKKGGYGIPYPPFVSLHLKANKKRIYRGAYYIE
ncbi:Ca2+/Na+ antiporter [Desulfohalotomaculum tongense]|uniref:hypothetical protein n=1 Tax=Desulforadius tongensis TaxID=1216062 RepID=UPI00195BE4ED|nr:hypothetical protein [Desulforadius tongensis]MBM7854947.1 Ca2+/Na+ antiporter [Desulforadius tongensis]